MSTREFIYDGFDVDEPNRKSTINAISEFELLLDCAENEEQIHAFLKQHPYFLTRLHPHCHHAISKPKLSTKYIPDFLLPEMSSAGIEWILVELEPATTKLITRSGHLNERVRGAIQQVLDWKRWLEQNRDHAIRSIPRGGLGLEELELPISCQIIAGRRKDISERFNQLRADWSKSGITIMTYDRVLEWSKQKIARY